MGLWIFDGADNNGEPDDVPSASSAQQDGDGSLSCQCHVHTWSRTTLQPIHCQCELATLPSNAFINTKISYFLYNKSFLAYKLYIYLPVHFLTVAVNNLLCNIIRLILFYNSKLQWPLYFGELIQCCLCTDPETFHAAQVEAPKGPWWCHTEQPYSAHNHAQELWIHHYHPHVAWQPAPWPHHGARDPGTGHHPDYHRTPHQGHPTVCSHYTQLNSTVSPCRGTHYITDLHNHKQYEQIPHESIVNDYYIYLMLMIPLWQFKICDHLSL